VNYSIPQTPADRLIMILERLHQALGHHADAQGRLRRGHLIGPFLVLIWGRVRRIGLRFAARVAREAANPPRQQPVPDIVPENVIASREAARQSRSVPQPGSSTPQPETLPRRKAWLLTMIPETGPVMGQLRAFLGDPEVATLLAGSPRLQSILNPLCTMLGINPASIQAAALQRIKALAAQALAAQALTAEALTAEPPPPPDAPPATPAIPIHDQAPPQAAPITALPRMTPPPPAAPPQEFSAALR
jgi:hypothetical protein